MPADSRLLILVVKEVFEHFTGWLRNRTGTGNRSRRNVFPGTERGTGTAGTVFREPKPEPEPPLSVKLY